eukprot:g993.t1
MDTKVEALITDVNMMRADLQGVQVDSPQAKLDQLQQQVDRGFAALYAQLKHMHAPAYRAMALWELWPRVEAVVKHESYMSANDEFTKLKTAILKSGDLGAQAKYATVTWELWQYHVEEVPKEAKVEKVKVSGKEVEWPDWGALEAAVRMEHYMGANEEFRLLRLAVLAADPLQLASQVGQAAMVWEFLVGFGEKKAHFRSQLGEVIGLLAGRGRWSVVDETESWHIRAEARLQLLPEVLQKALGPDHSEAEEASNSASFSQENLEVPTEEAYCSPSFESLEDRLKSMMGCSDGI